MRFFNPAYNNNKVVTASTTVASAPTDSNDAEMLLLRVHNMGVNAVSVSNVPTTFAKGVIIAPLSVEVLGWPRQGTIFYQTATGTSDIQLCFGSPA